MKNNFDQYRPQFTMDSLVRTVQSGSETIYLYQGRGLVSDSKTEKYIDYAPVKDLELPTGYVSATTSAFCQGCMLYKYPGGFSVITNPDKQVVRITELLSPVPVTVNSSWWYLVIVFLPILILWLILRIYTSRMTSKPLMLPTTANP